MNDAKHLKCVPAIHTSIAPGPFSKACLSTWRLLWHLPATKNQWNDWGSNIFPDVNRSQNGYLWPFSSLSSNNSYNVPWEVYSLKMFNVIIPTFQSHLTVWPLEPDACKHCRNSIRMKLAPWIVKLLVSVANLLKFLLGPRKRYDQPTKGEITKNYDQW